MGQSFSDQKKVAVFWFRRDLRINDNHGLLMSLKSGLPVLPLFIFDIHILEELNRDDARVSFLYSTISQLKNDLEKSGSSLKIFYSDPLDAFIKLLKEFDVVTVYGNKDYEPYGIDRDKKIKDFLTGKDVDFKLYKDHVIYEEDEILKNDNKPYTVFTPYSKKWKLVQGKVAISTFSSENYISRLLRIRPFHLPELGDRGFINVNVDIPSKEISERIIINYSENRDFPAMDGTTRLGIHLRFGTLSIRKLVNKAIELSEVFLNELIWRDFFSSVLYHFPGIVNNSFRSKYNFINWRNDEKDFERWCNGETGYPMVDAGMRELNQTGFMHNRVRMVTASFLVKHLLIDWRWGEAYFAGKLLDFELSSNNGNWQWAAGTGCDAAPYFRIFNPERQQKRFDPQNKYIYKWVPEYGTSSYPSPIVDHKYSRNRALQAYIAALNRDNL